jgi:hypothetical protein
MKLQFDDLCITCNHHGINKKSKVYDTFIKTYKKLTNEELQNALCVSINQIKEYIPRCVSCIGCRTRFFFLFISINLKLFYLI